MFPCRNRKCGYSTNIIKDLIDHSRTHDNYRTSTCDVCYEEFIQRSAMLTHKKIIHTLDKEYHCQYCITTSFDRLQDLNKHIRKVHDGVEIYICKYKKCKEMFPTLTALTFHENKKHNDVIINKSNNKYKCEYCPYSTDYKADKAIHENSHLGIRSYTCKICSFSFTKSSNLKKHQKIHTLDKKFICRYCYSSFSRISDRVSHTKKVHNKDYQSYSCRKCNDKFETILTYNNHRKFAHIVHCSIM